MSDPKPTTEAEAYPEALKKREHRLLEKRRADAKVPWNPDNMVGVGLSGGGIRSATFALGLFQGMAKKTDRRKGLLRYIDFLSTVSGGGYFGSFFGRLLNRDYVESPEDVEEILHGRKKPEVLRFLRENGRYLAPSGAGDTLLLGSAYLRNWVSIHIVLGLFVLTVFLGLQSLRGGLELFGLALDFPLGEDALIWWSPLLWLPLATFVFVALPIGWAYWLVEPERTAITGEGNSANFAQEISSISPLVALALIFVFSIFLALLTAGWIAGVWGALALIAVLTYVCWIWAKKRVQKDDARDRKKSAQEEPARQVEWRIYDNKAIRNRLGLWVTRALVITGLLFVLALVDSLGQSVYAVLKGESTLGAWLAAIFGSLGVLTGFSRTIAAYFSKGPQGGRPSLPVSLLAGVAAVLIILLLLVTLDAGSHAVAFGLGAPKGAPSRLLEAKKDESASALKIVPGTATALGIPVCLDSRPDCAPPKEIVPVDRDAGRALLGFAVALLVSILFGQTWPFVNRSSHLPLYAARLTRAYLGASNPKRWSGHNLTEPVEGDDADLRLYWPPPEKNGAPIHLINVTINETIDGQSQVQQQDRKGLGLALGPWGLSAGVRHHLVVPLGNADLMPDPEKGPVYGTFPKESFRVFDYPEGFTGEALSLGTWLSISGAAFSTGTGMRTSLGLSFLAGFANVRLGRWWDSGVTPEQRQQTASSANAAPTRRKVSLRIEDAVARLFPVQTYLLDEFLARFPGTSRRHWYLSDGGHFENMGGYELLRRRLRFVVIVDGEMDSGSTFEGLANLVRKARIDFDAEVRFLGEDDLNRVLNDKVKPYIGPLGNLRRGKWEDVEEGLGKVTKGRFVEDDPTGRSLAHAALARVVYDSDDKAVSWLLYVKPTLTEREPVDILEYHKAHPKFPHEPTIDQFFDEAQWESYRRLGEYIADMLFGELERLLPEDDSHPEGSLLAKWRWPEGEEERKREMADSEKGVLPSYS